MDNPAGLTPRQWEERLEATATSPPELAQVLADLEQEMRQEKTWLHENPSPAGVLAAILDFFDSDDDDLEALGEQIRGELERERYLASRYRAWRPGETWGDRIAPFVKELSAEVRPTSEGIQFAGFSKYAGVAAGAMMVFFISDRFPGRDPANFHITLDHGLLVLKRIYKMELPRLDGTSTARAVLAEMIRTLAPDLTIERLVVNNAANRQTRQALIASRPGAHGATFETIADADPTRTILGHLMIRLTEELGLVPGELTFRVLPFGLLRLDLPVREP